MEIVLDTSLRKQIIHNLNKAQLPSKILINDEGHRLQAEIVSDITKHKKHEMVQNE
jgi:hypothetical protein